MNDVIIVGAGASGMVAAIAAAREGASVLMLEHKECAGKKILATGNGKCNYTNSHQTKECYRSGDIEFVWRALNRFNVENVISLFKEIGIYPYQKNGYYYPNSQQAASVRDALLYELRRLGVKIITDCGVRKIEPCDSGFVIDTKLGEFSCKRCIIACGGKSAKNTGSDGSGYIYAKQLGHSVTELAPALVQLTATGVDIKKIAGVRCQGKISLVVNSNIIAEDSGELQFTDYGISGIPTFQVSRFVTYALNRSDQVSAKLDIMPDISEIELYDELMDRFKVTDIEKTAYEAMSGLINSKLAGLLLELAGIGAGTPAMRVREKKLQKLCALIKGLSINISGTKGFDSAQVTAGGIPVTELKDTMESQIVDGLFFAGEIIDVDGICGGYNLQWAWTSGMIAGQAAAK